MAQSQQPEIIEDFLEADDEIRGQNYVCLSFVSPENVLKNKELHFQKKFLRHLLVEKKEEVNEEFIENLDEKYKDFLYNRQDDFEKEYSELNDFQTTVRGIKVRGTYDSLKEAQIRAKILQRKDKNFNVFVGQVGYWLPWDPNPHKVENQEYFESELNELVKKYKENQEDKAEHFRENIDYVKEQAAKKVEEEKKLAEALKTKETVNSETVNSSESEIKNNSLDPSIQQSLESEDPWLAAKKRQSDENINDANNNESV